MTSTPENWGSARTLMPISNHMVTANIVVRGIANIRPIHVKKRVVTETRIKF
jgi:hypothetical protein